MYLKLSKIVALRTKTYQQHKWSAWPPSFLPGFQQCTLRQQFLEHSSMSDRPFHWEPKNNAINIKLLAFNNWWLNILRQTRWPISGQEEGERMTNKWLYNHFQPGFSRFLQVHQHSARVHSERWLKSIYEINYIFTVVERTTNEKFFDERSARVGGRGQPQKFFNYI